MITIEYLGENVWFVSNSNFGGLTTNKLEVKKIALCLLVAQTITMQQYNAYHLN
jgi:hypothetical protein